jgi:hypothetical protein
MIDRLFQSRRHLVRVMKRIAVVFHGFARCTISSMETSARKRRFRTLRRAVTLR